MIIDSVSYLISQYRNKPLIAAIARANQKAWQRVEDATNDLLAAFDVDSADLVRLKLISKWVGQPFRGESTEAFRIFVKGRIAARRSLGSTPSVVRVARILDSTSKIFRIWPACLWVELDDEAPDLDTQKAKKELLGLAKAPGVSLVVTDLSETEAFAEVGDPGSSLTEEVEEGGWGLTTDPSVGSIATVTI